MSDLHATSEWEAWNERAIDVEMSLPQLLEQAHGNALRMHDELLARIAELEADRDEWMAESDLNLRTLLKCEGERQKAEAEVAETQAVLKAIHDNPLGNVEELQAELAALKGRLAYIEGQPTCRVEDVLADLRAEEGKT